MPHITVKPFECSLIEKGSYNTTEVLFTATDTRSSDKLVAVKHEGESFLLHLKKNEKSWLLKYDKVTRPLKVNLVKQAIADLSDAFDLEIEQSNIAIHQSKATLANTYEKNIEDFNNIEFPFERVAIEVGFGSGKHLLYQAQNHPNQLFIGIEIHTPSAAQVLKQIKLLGLNNVWVVNYDARLLLESIPSNSCHKIFVHFPVPWDKKPQRRVISGSFLEESMRVLEKAGRLELRTDSYKYFWYALDTFLGDKVSKTSVEVRKNEALAVTSKYEARWIKQEKNIYDVYVSTLEESEVRVLDFDFSFKKLVYSPELLEKLNFKPFVFEDSFIHFERLFMVGEDAILLKLAFGSFDRPEHKFIYMDKNMVYYFHSNPVKTLINHKTHFKIMEYLHA